MDNQYQPQDQYNLGGQPQQGYIQPNNQFAGPGSYNPEGQPQQGYIPPNNQFAGPGSYNPGGQPQQGYIDPYNPANREMVKNMGAHQPQAILLEDELTPEENHKANIMCVISLFFGFVIPLFCFGLITFMGEYVEQNAGTDSSFSSVLTMIMSLSYLASWIIMIIVRVKYKANKFGKILMWIHIGILALGVLSIILVIVACFGILSQCSNQ